MRDADLAEACVRVTPKKRQQPARGIVALGGENRQQRAASGLMFRSEFKAGDQGVDDVEITDFADPTPEIPDSPAEALAGRFAAVEEAQGNVGFAALPA